MRRHLLGATRPVRGWCESFKPVCLPRRKEVGEAPADEHKRDDDIAVDRKGPSAAACFPTWKGEKRMEKLRHYFHQDMAYLLEADPDVIRWSARVEPFRVEYEDGEVREYPHTMCAETSHGTRHISLHYRERRLKPNGDNLAEPVAMRGRVFESYTRDDLVTHPRLQTSKDILFHRSRELEPELALRTFAMSVAAFPATLGDLHRDLGPEIVSWEEVVCLVAQGYVVVNLDFALGPNMPIISCEPHGHQR